MYKLACRWKNSVHIIDISMKHHSIPTIMENCCVSFLYTKLLHTVITQGANITQLSSTLILKVLIKTSYS